MESASLHSAAAQSNFDDDAEFKNHIIKELDHDFDDLLENLPQVKQYVHRLKNIIRKQQKKLSKLFVKLKERKILYQDAAVQTGEHGVGEKNEEKSKEGWDMESGNIAEQVAEAAESAMLSMAGFVLEPQSGMYYNFNSGYYYNAKLGLYYDGNSGRYLEYDAHTQQYRYKADSATSSSSAVVVEKRADIPRVGKTDKIKTVAGGPESLIRRLAELRLSHHPSRQFFDWPPCMRIIVTETEIAKGLSKGDLFIVTYHGGTIGREGLDLAVLLPENAVSKIHAKISFDNDQYWITDMGSRNGTFVNGKRISAALQESEPIELSHKDELRIGTTKLNTHIHIGRETCPGCEPGLLQQEQKDVLIDGQQLRTRSSKEAYRDGLSALKKRFGVDGGGMEASKEGVDAYEDRAEKRRATVGSSHHAEKTQTASLHEAIPSSNKGFKMLSKMGWAEGDKLGKNEQGLAEPVPLVSNEGTAGLGSGWSENPIVEATRQQKKKQAVLKATQQRYMEERYLPDDRDDGGE